MQSFLNSPFTIGDLQLSHRLIQGPLAGYSCAPFRQLFSLYTPPAFAVSEMLSAHDVLNKHSPEGRYLYRAPLEELLCYQLAGTDPAIMAGAAAKLTGLGADLIDINCGCPKNKIRKKGAGSALLEQPERLIVIIKAVRAAIQCPLTVKIRLQVNGDDIDVAKKIADAGADALIIHGRRWIDDYDKPCNLGQIERIKRAIDIPVVVNGDISDASTLTRAVKDTGADAFMIARASTGKPWLFEELLQSTPFVVENSTRISLFMTHLKDLANLENEYQAVLQSKSLVRYYFRNELNPIFLQRFYNLANIQEIELALKEELLGKLKLP